MSRESQSTRTDWQNAIGHAAKQLYSLVYVTGFEPEYARSLYTDNYLGQTSNERSLTDNSY